MSNLAKKYSEYPNRNLRVVKGEKQQNKSKLFFVFLLVFAIIGVTIVSLHDSSNPESKSAPKTSIDWENPPCLPSDLSSDWDETTHPKRAEKSNRRDFKNIRTGEKIAFDKGTAGRTGNKAKNHWHRYNINTKNRKDFYLDKNGNQIHKNDDNSHIDVNCK